MKLLVFAFMLLFWLVLKSSFSRTEMPDLGSSVAVDFDYVTHPAGTRLEKGQHLDEITGEISTFQYEISRDKDGVVRVASNFLGTWEVPVPPNYVFDGQNLVPKPVCAPGDTFVPATGIDLYDYIMRHDFTFSKRAVRTNNEEYAVDDELQKRLYFFKCGDEPVLFHCPDGEYFGENNSCVEVDLCVHKNDGFKYPMGFYSYYECLAGKSVLKRCPSGQVFGNGKCTLPENPCQFTRQGYVRRDDSSYYRCSNYEATIVYCKEGEYYASDGKCLDERCKGRTGIVPTPAKYAKKLAFNDGYLDCDKGTAHVCDRQWNYERVDFHLPFLPKVFHEGSCVDPNLCVNVDTLKHDVTVQKRTWRQAFPRSETAAFKDRLEGYRCIAGKRVDFSSSNDDAIIDPVTLTLERYCENGKKRKIARPRYHSYYDCVDGEKRKCPSGQYFNMEKEECFDLLKRGHKIQDLAVFDFGILNQDNWMPSSNYLGGTVRTCDPGQKYVVAYDTCVVPECEKYLFVAQIKRPIKIDENNECYYESHEVKTRSYEKEKEDENRKLNFWLQRFEYEPHTPCVYGRKVESGDFVMDSTVYATCDKDVEPFVFCPSNDTAEIVKSPHGKYVCFPNRNVGLRHLRETSFLLVELEKKGYVIVPKNAALTVSVPKEPEKLFRYSDEKTLRRSDFEAMGFPSPSIDVLLITKFTLKCTRPMEVRLELFTTNQPDVYISDGEVKVYYNMSYIHRLGGGSKRNVVLPLDYEVTEKLEEYVE